MIRCILFDRDGTLGELSDDRYPTTFTPFFPIREIFSALKAKGLAVGIITNQSSIARGTGKGYDFDAEFQSYGTDIWEICPHDNNDRCNCRKPKSGMLLSVTERLQIRPEECVVVGDRLSDILCAENVGAKGILVLTGKGQAELPSVRKQFPNITVLDRFDEILNHIQKNTDYSF